MMYLDGSLRSYLIQEVNNPGTDFNYRALKRGIVRKKIPQ